MFTIHVLSFISPSSDFSTFKRTFRRPIISLLGSLQEPQMFCQEHLFIRYDESGQNATPFRLPMLMLFHFVTAFERR